VIVLEKKLMAKDEAIDNLNEAQEKAIKDK